MLGIDAFPAAEVKNMKVDTRQTELAKMLAHLAGGSSDGCLATQREARSDVGFKKDDWYRRRCV